ncbi:hypothetical protein EHQ12_05765 [Leptospira gomenensis]|uniref:Uncharacterized protein n=1 Tax=Leptospira gomenensis TaxID=2484974 RepID=A0A5F1YE29_9LEPT|nr:hypothetical protein [Leptospira gomenensis]TGK36049.1 hypothetical protein EHQ17_05595 [Leptospira gomenensis]TGK41794.1 hypothetical protein EHQ12_05765 [Leptospira gomenensis]TGK53348.1 hypothetical protein EHQ07_00135 [Leptospira gomenensis]TGK64954.1 hypothetical protein EHQ13_06380 [Leptospira gomenensis]
MRHAQPAASTTELTGKIRDNLDPVILSEIKEKSITQIAEYARERFVTFDWRWNDHEEMEDKTITSLFLMKNEMTKICGADREKIREFISVLECILEEEEGE